MSTKQDKIILITNSACFTIIQISETFRRYQESIYLKHILNAVNVHLVITKHRKSNEECVLFPAFFCSFH